MTDTVNLDSAQQYTPLESGDDLVEQPHEPSIEAILGDTQKLTGGYPVN